MLNIQDILQAVSVAFIR